MAKPLPELLSVRVLPVALAAAAVLLWPAVFNGFPLIFPDSGTYLGIAYGQEYAVDRSSVYGFMLKPLVTLLPGEAGLWLGVAGQALAVAAVLIVAARHLHPGITPVQLLGCIAAATLLTSLAWHAAQFMPDAFTGPVLLLAWLAASRDPAAPGAPLLWLAAIALALTHYTHLVLLAGGAGTAILAHALLGMSFRACARRALAALLAVAAVTGALTAANAAALGRASLSPMGSLFLFARLNEDGLIPAWFDRHCGRDAPAALCAIRRELPRDSQMLLWGGSATPVSRLIWHDVGGTRWQWIEMMGQANRGAIAERPLEFLGSTASGTLRQFTAFAAIDDECPTGCRDLVGGINFTLNKHRPQTVASLQASRQVRDTTGKSIVRAVTTPMAALSLLLLPFALLFAWRRRDVAALSLVAVVTTGLLINAGLAGALSDVHDRYQSRVVWLVPFVLMVLTLKWKSVSPTHSGVSESPDTAHVNRRHPGLRRDDGQTFSRSRISLPGLK